MTCNLLKWCDEKISYLKDNNIVFINGLPVIPKDSVISEIPYNISTFSHRNSIPDEYKPYSVISSFIPDKDIFVRLKKVDSDIEIFKQYAGICGLDLSPSIFMLLPRQRLSLLVNAVYNCYCALQGIKIIPNGRLGELATMSMSSSIPQGVNIISSNLGCRKKDFKSYGFYQLILLIESHHPPVVFIYGNLLTKEAEYIYSARHNFRLIVFPDVRHQDIDNKKTFEFIKTPS